MPLNFGNADFVLGETVVSSGSAPPSRTPRVIISRDFEESTSALKLVSPSGESAVGIADPTTALAKARVLGLSMNSVSSGAGEILTYGPWTDSVFEKFSLGKSLFLGEDGAVVDSIPENANYLTAVGYALGGGSIFISPGPIIVL